VAGHQFLNQLSAQVRLDAVETIQALLRSSAGDEDESEAGREQEALMHATRDVVAKTDASFQVNALVAALARIVAGQQEEINTLKRTTEAFASSNREPEDPW
jgi:hypothetical protein